MAAFDGQVALVTGASRGIGRAVAEQLGAAGAHVFVNYVRGIDAATETKRLIELSGGRADLLPFDVSDPDAVAASFKVVQSDAGRLDVLVNNAGAAIDNLVLRMKAIDWDQVMAINLRGTFNCTREAAKLMVRARYGRVINLSSVIGLSGNAGQGAYAAAKAGIIGFTKSMAQELVSRNITVNAVAPGFIETDMTDHLPEDRRTEYLSRIPIGRMGTAHEVADAVVFLARREAAYITGQVLGVNGGLYM